MFNATRYDYFANSNDNEILNVDIPRICRHCHQTGEQSFLNATILRKFFDEDEDKIVDTDFVVFTGCSYCGEVTQHYGTEHYIYGNCTYSFGRTIPEEKSTDIQIPKNVLTLSSDFLKIYNQALQAEKNELDHLAGMGYRKAIEFLVTDFLSKYTPEGVSKDWLNNPNTRLDEKINKLRNERIKKLSKAITYLGNDEAHYVRRHPEYNVQNLKEFIKVLMSDFENELIFEEAEKLLSKPKK